MNFLYPRDWGVYLTIFMIFLRLLGFFILVPGFSHRSIPSSFKLLFAVIIALALFPVLRHRLLPVPMDVGGMALYAVRETAIGFLMGFVAFLTFEAIHLAAQFVGYQMGFGAVGLIDPVNHSSVSVLVPLTGWIALMVFFFTDMHHQLIRLFVYSFEITRPVSIGALAEVSVVKLFIQTSANLFVVAVKIAAPFTLLVLASNCGVGILSRLLPQMHMILFVFPVTIFLGMCTLYLLAPDLIDYFEEIMEQMGQDVLILLRTI